MRLKKRIGRWLGLACIFLTGASAGALGYCLSGMLADGFSGNVEGHQPMLSHATRYQLASEQEHGSLGIGLDLEAAPIVQDQNARMQPDPHRCLPMAQFGADHAECGLFDLEQIANSYLYLSQFIAQRHLQPRYQNQQPYDREYGAEHPTWNLALISRHHRIPSLRNAIFSYRQLYSTFRNQFISRIEFLHLKDARNSSSVTLFRSISCPRPLVLRQRASRTLGSAPADSFPQWRHRSSMVDPAKFTIQYCEQAMRDNQFDTAALYGNIRRALQGKQWIRHRIEQPKLRKATGGTQAGNLRQLANGGSPKLKPKAVSCQS